MKEETFDYSKVPHNFGLCATDTCPYTDTCLRRIAYTYAPSNNIFLYVLNPKAIESTAGKCRPLQYGVTAVTPYGKLLYIRR